jgi:hypothetical protein
MREAQSLKPGGPVARREGLIVMRLVRVFYEPYTVFAELRDGRWFPALCACLLLSLISAAMLINIIGPDVVMGAAENTDGFGKRPDISKGALTFGLYAVKPVLTILALVLTALSVRALLSVVGSASKYAVVLAVCSYAAYIREFLMCGLTTSTLIRARILGAPPRSFTTDLTLLLSGSSVGSPLYHLLRRIDLLTIAFLTLVAIGLWRTDPSIRIGKSIAVVFSLWLIYLLVKTWV